MLSAPQSNPQSRHSVPRELAMIGTIVAKPVRSGEGTVVADIDFTLIDRTPTARVHKRAAPAAKGVFRSWGGRCRMRSEIMKPDRRQVLRAAAMGLATGGVAKMLGLSPASAAEADAIRPFRIDVPEQDLVDLRRRLAATRWPDKETVADDS